MLAPFGVGTVDQALLGVLQTKHVFVRLFGLAHKVVIIDEVHAYDTYMSTLIERLLMWLAALGTPVVLLSATLPGERRQKLLAAYAKGLGLPAPMPVPASYPRISWVSATGAGAAHVPAAGTRTLGLRWVDGAVPPEGEGEFALGVELQRALADGGCAAVICNTVKRAQQVYGALRRYFPGTADDGLPELDLFHARYRFTERDGREKRALLRFGKQSAEVEMGEGGRRRYASAAGGAGGDAGDRAEPDLDFDLMVTDLAPVDLVLQRSGRLWRHQRPSRPAGVGTGPVLRICRPRITGDGIPQYERGFEYIYDAHVLLRSWLVLRDREGVTLPEEMDALIESVYWEEPVPPDLPEPVRAHWQATWVASQTSWEQDSRKAQDCELGCPLDENTDLSEFTCNPQKEDAPEIHKVFQALTRLSEPTIQVILLLPDEAARLYDPTAKVPPTGGQVRDLLRCAVTLGDWRVVDALLGEEPPAAWKGSALLRHYRLLLLDEQRSAQVGDCVVRLDTDLGIVVSSRRG